MRSIKIYHLLLILICSCNKPFNKIEKNEVDPMINFSYRRSENGNEIISSKYIDQPYIIKLQDGKWFCCVTVGISHEGSDGETVKYMTSSDKGKTWSEAKNIEDDTTLSSSYGMAYNTLFNRIYVFYNYNGDNINKLKGKDIRKDMLGWYCFRYSDDSGKTWSKRYRIPIRQTLVDKLNDWKGEVQMFWAVGEPIRTQKGMYLGLSKIGNYLIDNTEGWFIHSPNIETVKDPDKLIWNILPDGEQGVRSPSMGNWQEEHNLVELNNGDLYCVFRTQKGYCAYSISKDGGRTWQIPLPLSYQNPNKLIRHPRACSRIWKCKNGKYLLWFHNTSEDVRNPVWICGGQEINGNILWSEPELLLYSTDLSQRFSYPDLIEEDRKYYISYTQKTKAILSEIDSNLINGLWEQNTRKPYTLQKNIILNINSDNTSKNSNVTNINSLVNGSFTIELLVKFDELRKNDILINNYDLQNSNKGLCIKVGENNNLILLLNDGSQEIIFKTNSYVFKDLNNFNHITFIVDGEAKIITSLVNGQLCDTGNTLYGWTRIPKNFKDINTNSNIKINNDFAGKIKKLIIYNRQLTTSESINNYLLN